MKSFIVLASILYLGVVVSAAPDLGLVKFLAVTPENVMAKCLKESNLEADKDKLLTDPSAIDPAKLGCVVACISKTNGVLVNGEIKYDVLAEKLSNLYTAKEDKIEKKLELLRLCIPEAANSKNECEYIQKILMCKFRRATELGL